MTNLSVDEQKAEEALRNSCRIIRTLQGFIRRVETSMLFFRRQLKGHVCGKSVGECSAEGPVEHSG